MFKDYIIKYNNKDGNFLIIDYKKSKMIKTDLKNYQNSVYNVIINFFKKKIIKINFNYKDAAVTHKILKKL